MQLFFITVNLSYDAYIVAYFVLLLHILCCGIFCVVVEYFVLLFTCLYCTYVMLMYIKQLSFERPTDLTKHANDRQLRPFASHLLPEHILQLKLQKMIGFATLFSGAMLWINVLMAIFCWLYGINPYTSRISNMKNGLQHNINTESTGRGITWLIVKCNDTRDDVVTCTGCGFTVTDVVARIQNCFFFFIL